MTTLTSEGHSAVLHSEADLQLYFQQFAKSRADIRVGLEAEFFAVDRKNGLALPYQGPAGIHAILKVLASHFGYEPVYDEGSVIALKKDDRMIGLEPGGQMELSAPPVASTFEIEEQAKAFIRELKAIAAEFPNAAWLAVGVHPFSRIEEIEWVPKRRYQIMAEYLAAHGTLSHEMMKRTATNQINMDYLSEENAMANLRVAFGITSVVTALFAHSSFSEGAPNGFACRRLEIWNHTDPDRTGLLLEFTQPGRHFKDYLEYLLNMPLIFIVRKGEWHPVGNLTFRQFIRQGFHGMKATVSDFELHLSTAFPEVRLKQYLEIRGVDGQRPDLIPAVAAFWKGILYDTSARERAWELVSFASDAERLRLHQDVPCKGLRAQLGDRPILPIARELVEISCSSLARQMVQGQVQSECVYLDRIRETLTRSGKSPGDILLEKWNGELDQNPERLIDYLSIFSP